MKFLHYELQLGADDLIRVQLDKQANVRLMDPPNFLLYRNGRGHRYYGGLAIKTPFLIRAPRSGRWHLVVDRGSCGGTVRIAVSVISEGVQAS